MSCLFCRIVEGDIPATMVYQDQHLIVIEDLHPVAPLHLLLIPKKHIVNTLDLLPEDDQMVGHLFRIASDLAKKRGFDESGFRIVTNSNADAGQSVFHIHFHLIGGRSMQWPPG